MKKLNLNATQQLEFDKKHFRLIALGWRPIDIANALNINIYDEGNNRKKLYLNYVIADTREVVIFATKNNIITTADLELTLAPVPSTVDWSKVKDIP